ncbi:MAG: glycerophosphodiester phosphodiesterase family protein [Bacteroides sp.]|nr:glycerophosphodiester phosphodiesterase family protein [Bacteroides sp.]
MRKIYLLFAWMFLTLPLLAQGKVEQIREKLLTRDQTSVIVVSHRGDWRSYPENSLDAIKSIMKMGGDVVEIDVQRTKDGVLILMHDGTLDRTSTGKGKIADFTWKELRQLRLKDTQGNPTRHKIPTLEQVLKETRGKIMLNLDKADRYFDEVYALLKKTGTEKQIIMKGTKPAEKVKEQFGKYLDDVIYMPIIHLYNKDAEAQILAFVDDMNPVAFEMVYKDARNPLPERLPALLNGRSLLWYNTLWDSLAGGHTDDKAVDDPAGNYGYVIDTLGARIIQTDRPQYLLDYLRSRGLHD